MKKTIVLALSLAVMIANTGCGTSAPANDVPPATTEEESGADLDPALLKSVTFYVTDYESGEWIEVEKWEYSYENAYPVSKTISHPGSDDIMETTFSYNFEGELPVSMERFDDGVKAYTSEYSNGRLSVLSQCFEDEVSSRHQIYSYGNDDDYFTSVLHSSHIGDYDPTMPCYNAEEIDTVMVSTQNGLLKQTINSGLYTNWLDSEDREWMRFNGRYTVNYDANGIAESTSCEYRDDQIPMDYHFNVSITDGKVSEVIRTFTTSEIPEETNERKTVFEYTDIATDSGRYSRMINAHIMDEGNNFYIYNWY